MNHWSLFLIAEVDGRPGATLCGYDADTQGRDALMAVAANIAPEEAVVLDDAFFERAAIVGNVSHDTVPGAWVIEDVATHPEFRRRGLVRQLLRAVLDRARARGFNTAQVSVFIGNDSARDAYLELGFESVGEKRDPDFRSGDGQCWVRAARAGALTAASTHPHHLGAEPLRIGQSGACDGVSEVASAARRPELGCVRVGTE